MGRILEIPSIKPRSTSRHQGLRKLSPDLISKARDETATQVTRVGLTFLGTAAFCLLSLLSPDIALLGGSDKISVPFAGPVSFFGFMLLGPAVLIALRVYLQIYVEHSNRLDRLARSASVARAPILAPLQNPLLRLFSGLMFYILLPVTTTLFAWKAAVFPAWGLALFSVAAAVIASHVMLPSRLKGLRSVSAAIVAGGVMLVFGPPHRPFDLYRANLSDQRLVGEDLRNANLISADLRGADLRGADLGGADLSIANLSKADLRFAKLSRAYLKNANLRGANLTGADLRGADLSLADLSIADLSDTINLTQPQLDTACGTSNTKLVKGLTLKECSVDVIE
jgi:Pentapeptide repeats (8 copies)